MDATPKNSPPDAGPEKKGSSGCLGCLGLLTMLVVAVVIFSPTESERKAAAGRTAFAGRYVTVAGSKSFTGALTLDLDGNYTLKMDGSGNEIGGTWGIEGATVRLKARKLGGREHQAGDMILKAGEKDQLVYEQNGIEVVYQLKESLASQEEAGTKSEPASAKKENPSEKAGDEVLKSEVEAWLTESSWKCVDATSKGGGQGGSGLMKGATFEFTGGRLRVSGDEAEAGHNYQITSARKSGGNTFANLLVGKTKETLIKLPSENGLDLAGLTWGGAWTLKLARSAQDRMAAKENRCLANLKELDGAKEVWAAENKKKSGDECKMSDLVPAYIKVEPRCPVGGAYILNPIGVNPACPNHKPDDPHLRNHKLPE